MQLPGLKTDDIYLPAKQVDPRLWAVVACDQYTSQPDYWQRVADLVGEHPSTLHIVQPEIDLEHAAGRIPAIHEAMRKYLADGTLVCGVHNGFTLTRRTTASGTRLGLVAAVDLEAYDFTPGANALIRATEGTIQERIPPRMRIREGAILECPHVMLLLDDPDCTVIEPVAAALQNETPLYDFDLMENGGHLRIQAVEGALIESVAESLNALLQKSDGFLYAVGDGNHSLATAKACWEVIKQTLSEAEKKVHPARYALAEIVNLHSPALVFEPIHRVLFGCKAKDVIAAYGEYLKEKGMSLTDGTEITFVDSESEAGFQVVNPVNPLPVAVLQPFLDAYLLKHPEIRIDYVHGDEAVKAICRQENTVGILLPAIDKSALFPAVRAGGVLPRKTFSMGEANEKRFYMECRKIG